MLSPSPMRMLAASVFLTSCRLIQTAQGRFICKYAAFHRDAKYGFESIATGYRLCLIYHLVQIQPTAAAAVVVPTRGWPDTYRQLHDALDQWCAAGDAP
jgi:hypothetical protein